ncbi:MAG: porin family protein [Chitinophagaceae bacterium]
MKKYLFALGSLLLLTNFVKAQHTNYGLKAGYNSSSVQISNGTDYKGKSGLHIGGLAHIHVTSHFAVQPELVFSMQGGERTNSKLKMNYINVPVIGQFMVSDGFRLQTGPQIGFLVSAKQKVGDVEVDIDNSFSSVDFSWVFGAGYIFKSGFGIDARYNLGLSNVSDDNSFEAKNRVLQVGVFYQFTNHKGKNK